MKKLLFFALMAAAAISFNACSKDDNDRHEPWTDNSPIIEFEDPNFLKAITFPRNYSIDKNMDYQISEKEAGVVLELNVSGSNIGCMKEISYFTALGKLTCYSNPLTSLDLSNNKALEHLFCDDNQLTTLDVSKCKQLIFLSCSGNKNLKSVIVSRYYLERLKPDLDSIVREYGDIITYR